MDDLPFYVLFNSISVISGRWVGDNEKAVWKGTPSQLKRTPAQAGLKPGTARSAGQCLTWAPKILRKPVNQNGREK